MKLVYVVYNCNYIATLLAKTHRKIFFYFEAAAKKKKKTTRITPSENQSHNEFLIIWAESKRIKDI